MRWGDSAPRIKSGDPLETWPVSWQPWQRCLSIKQRVTHLLLGRRRFCSNIAAQAAVSLVGDGAEPHKLEGAAVLQLDACVRAEWSTKTKPGSHMCQSVGAEFSKILPAEAEGSEHALRVKWRQAMQGSKLSRRVMHLRRQLRSQCLHASQHSGPASAPPAATSSAWQSAWRSVQVTATPLLWNLTGTRRATTCAGEGPVSAAVNRRAPHAA